MINMPGGPEMLVIAVVALLVLGPQQLPKAMRTMGSVMAEIRKVSNSFQAEMRNAMDTVVDVTGNEKPQSGTMAPVSPYRHERDDADVTEVVASNVVTTVDAPEGTDATPSVGAADPTSDGVAPDPDVPERPRIDPADRAAG